MLDLGERKQSNLWRPPTPFVGRKAEIGQIDEWLDSGRRIITVLGPGGAGKTRLLREVGYHLLPRFSGADDGGVWFVALNEARTLSDIVLKTAASLRRTIILPCLAG